MLEGAKKQCRDYILNGDYAPSQSLPPELKFGFRPDKELGLKSDVANVAISRYCSGCSAWGKAIPGILLTTCHCIASTMLHIVDEVNCA